MRCPIPLSLGSTGAQIQEGFSCFSSPRHPGCAALTPQVLGH